MSQPPKIISQRRQSISWADGKEEIDKQMQMKPHKTRLACNYPREEEQARQNEQ